MPQLDNLDVTLTVEQNLLVFTHLYRIPRPSVATRSSGHSRWRSLGDRRDTRVDKLSGGMRRRLLIARALVHRPRLVLLDEPTVGLDPQVRQELWALIDALRSEGTTILMSTHYIEEAAAPRRHRADHVPRQGSRRRPARRSSWPSTPAERRSRSTGRLPGWPRSRPRRQPPGCATRRTGTSVSILGVDGGDGLALEGERRPANLEDVFVLLTGEEIG